MSQKKKKNAKPAVAPKRDRFGHFIGKHRKPAKKPVRKPTRVLTEDPVRVTKPVEAVGIPNDPLPMPPLPTTTVTLADYASLNVLYRTLLRRCRTLRDLAFAKDGESFRSKLADLLPKGVKLAKDAQSVAQENERLERANHSLLAACEHAHARITLWKTLALLFGLAVVGLATLRLCGF